MVSGSRPCQPAGVHQVALEGMRGHAQPRVSRSRSNLEQVRRHRSGVVSLTQAAPSSLARTTGSDAVDPACREQALPPVVA